MPPKIVAILGTYRKGGITDQTVTEILRVAQMEGALTSKIYLLDKHIEFCTNCRSCTQQSGPERRGKCVLDDEMVDILDQIDSADGLVFACPVNCYSVTAVMKRFIERLLVYFYWPWGARSAPKNRITRWDKKAVILTSSASPALLGRISMTSVPRLLKLAAKIVGARVVGNLFFGLAAGQADQKLTKRQLSKARRAGLKLLGGNVRTTAGKD